MQVAAREDGTVLGLKERDHREHRRLSARRVPPRPHGADGRRDRTTSRTSKSRSPARLHATRWRPAPIAARAGRRRPTTSSGSWTCWPTNWAWTRSRCAARTSSRPTPSPTTPPTGLDLRQRRLRAPLDEGARNRGLRRAARRAGSGCAQQGRYMGIGIATYIEICGFGPYESASVRVEPSGAVTVTPASRRTARGRRRPSRRSSRTNSAWTRWTTIVVVHGDTARHADRPGHDGLARPRHRRLGARDGRSTRSRRRRARSPRTCSKRRRRTSSSARAGSASRARRTRAMTLKEIAAAAYSGTLPADIGPAWKRPTSSPRRAPPTPSARDIAVVEVDPETGDDHV